VRKQSAAGIDVVSDGEFGKHSWFAYVMRRLDGYEVRRCKSQISALLEETSFATRTSLRPHPPCRPPPSVPSATYASDHANAYDASDDEYLAALADALHEEYATITDAGLIVQLDEDRNCDGCQCEFESHFSYPV
jgi:methionine synthase II (cobalamin-independent)